MTSAPKKPNLPSARRLTWMCRRGMLELDLLLERFVKKTYPKLDQDEQRLFVRMLEEEDPWLYAHLVKAEACGEPELQVLIEKIRATRHT